MADQEPKGVTDLRPQRHGGVPQQQSRQVFIDPRVDPQAAAYAAGMGARAEQRRAKAGLPKYTQQVGGPPLNIPLLDAEAVEGLPMAEQAARVNQPSQAQVMAQVGPQVPGSIVEPPAHIPTMQGQQQVEQSIINSIRPGDMLPDEAQRDPTFQHGGGALFAANQPHLVLKYGLVRGGQHLPPQHLAQQAQRAQSAPGRLSQDSIEGLQAMQAAMKNPPPTPPGMPKDDKEAEDQAAAGAAGQSSRVGRPLTAEEKEEDRRKIQEAIEKMDAFDYDALQRQLEEDILRNPEQRKIIEERLEPLDIDELITKNKVTQDVIVHPGKDGRGRLWFTFESMTGEDDLTLKQLIMKESKSIEVTGQYLLDKFAFMSIAVGLKSINGNPLPRHTDDNGKFNEDKFWIKFHWVLDKPLHLIACIGANHTWFEMRVRKMFVAEKLGNG